MRYLISESQLKKIFEQSEQALDGIVIKFFNYLNREKKKYKSKKELLSLIKEMMPFFGFSKGQENYLLRLYLGNYREDGDYSKVTKNNFVDPRFMKGERTTNTESDKYTKAKLPFKGSNLEGYWTKDNKNVEMYVVASYGWYPIYIFKEGIWYEVDKKYSSSTGRQMNNSNPIEYNNDIDTNVVLATRDEMKLLIQGATLKDILAHKSKKLKELEPELQKKRMTRAKEYGAYDVETNQRLPGYVVKFKINSIEQEGDKSVIVVDVYDVLRNHGNTSIPTPENYLKGELPNVTKERVENTIKRNLTYNLKSYLGNKFRYYEPPPEDSKIQFRFNHLKK